jgi:hypothetical protein
LSGRTRGGVSFKDALYLARSAVVQADVKVLLALYDVAVELRRVIRKTRTVAMIRAIRLQTCIALTARRAIVEVLTNEDLELASRLRPAT